MNPIYPFRTVYGISSARLHFFKSFLIIYSQLFFGFHLFLLMVVQTLLLLPFLISYVRGNHLAFFSYFIFPWCYPKITSIHFFSYLFLFTTHPPKHLISATFNLSKCCFFIPQAQTVKHGWSYSCFIKFSIEPNRYFDNINA